MSSSDPAHPNISRSQSLFRDLPRWKSNLESELWQNPSDLRSLFYIYVLSTLRTVALNRPIFKTKKMFANLSYGLAYSSTLRSYLNLHPATLSH
jgi:hypothetical protein